MFRHTLRSVGCAVLMIAAASVAHAEKSAPARPGQRCTGPYAPGDARLAVKAPTVTIRSYNGRVFIERPVAPSRSRDPMAIRTTGLQPGSTLTVERQGRSKSCGIGGGQTLCSKALPELAKQTLVWKSPGSGKLTFQPKVESTQAVDVEVYKNPEQVFWPHSRVRVSGTTRDGQAIPEVITTVDGLPAVNEQLYNHATGQVQSWRQSGRLLPSARAWIQADNLFASRPVVDRKSIGQGRTLLKEARRAERTLAHLQQWLQTATQLVQSETQKINSGAYADPADKAKAQKLVQKTQSGINKVNQVISSGPVKKNGSRGPTLQALAQQKKTQGQQVLAAGRVLRSVLVSIGGVPIDAPLQLSNPRLQGDRLPMSTASATADKAGYVAAEIGGIRQDTVRGEVVFAADSNKVGSRMRFEYKVPDGRNAPDAVIDGVRYYKINPTGIERQNDQPDAQ